MQTAARAGWTLLYLQHALYGVDPPQQVQASTEHAEHARDDTWESHGLQHLCGSCKTSERRYRLCRRQSQSVGGGGSARTQALVFGRHVGREAIDGPQVLRGQLVGRPQLDLCLHVGQVDFGGQRAGAVVALFGLLDEGVWWRTKSGETSAGERGSRASRRL